MEKLDLCSRFTANKITTNNALEGIMIKGEGETLFFYATDLTRFIKTELKTKNKHNFKTIISPKKIIDFLNLLSSGEIKVEVGEKALVISQGKTRGNFPLIVGDDFPLPPTLPEGERALDRDFFKQLNLVTFASSDDSVRPVLTGTNFVITDNDLILVATDGFRLSLLKGKKSLKIPPMIVPSVFLNEVFRLITDNTETKLVVSEEEKVVAIKNKETVFYSRLIQGDFPAYERVVPVETKTTIRTEKDELLRNIKLISVFARDQSNIVIMETLDRGLKLTPKTTQSVTNGDYAIQDAQIEGEGQRVAFNYKFIIDLLLRLPGKEIIIEMLRSDAPVVFKSDQAPGFLHIIMPVRISE